MVVGFSAHTGIGVSAPMSESKKTGKRKGIRADVIIMGDGILSSFCAGVVSWNPVLGGEPVESLHPSTLRANGLLERFWGGSTRNLGRFLLASTTAIILPLFLKEDHSYGG